jgi:hypothetical protein
MVGNSQCRKPAVACLAATFIKNPFEFGWFCQTCLPSKTRHARTQAAASDRQPGAALGATCLDDGPAVLGAHAGTKTMGPLALQVAGLKSSFHDTPNSKNNNEVVRATNGREKGAKGTVSAPALSTGKVSRLPFQGVDNFQRQV